LVLGACAAPSAEPPVIHATCVVSRVIDGDTFACRGGRRVRLLLIDTPELSQGRIGAQAAAVLQRLAPPGTSLGLEYDVQRRDQYERTLAYAWKDNRTMLNEALLREGYAEVAVYPPNVKYVDRFREIRDAAKKRRVGLWATDAFECAPRDYRARRC
jgi:micrococcal nuclease